MLELPCILADPARSSVLELGLVELAIPLPNAAHARVLRGTLDERSDIPWQCLQAGGCEGVGAVRGGVKQERAQEGDNQTGIGSRSVAMA